MRVVPLVLVLALVAGCVNVSWNRIGDRFAPRPEDCHIEYQYGDASKALALGSSGYLQVGTITVVKGGDDFSDAMKKRVRPIACEIGGDAVMMVTSSPGSFTTNYSYVMLMVLRRQGGVVGGRAPAP
jgi:hypothetical protein